MQDPKTHNGFKAMLLSGQQKKNPDKTWTGVLVEVTVDSVVYSGIVFPKRNNSIREDKAIKF